MTDHHKANPKCADLPRLGDFFQCSMSRKERLAKLRIPKATSPNTICGHDNNNWQASVKEDAGTIETRISMSTRHGRDPAKIELLSQQGLDQLGFDNAVENVGADTSYSGSGGPKLEDLGVFSKVFTKMIDASIAHRGNEAEAIDNMNRRFNCVGQEDFPYECAFDMIHSVVVTPVYPGTFIRGAKAPPDLVKRERGAARNVSMVDLAPESRIKAVLPIGSSRGKIIMKLAVNTIDAPNQVESSAGTLAHELGHSLLGLPDLYSGGTYRTDVKYMNEACLMGSSSAFSHFCAYNKRSKGWLEDDAILLLDRPGEDNEIDQEVILVQLEYWEPTFDAATWDAIAQTALPDAPPGTPVVAAVFLRLGGDGRQFDIIELRGKGPSFSNELVPTRVVISNAIDPGDDTRYAEAEVENAGVTQTALERYRQKVHIMSSDLLEISIGTSDDTYNFATDEEFPEVGLTAQVLEWGTASTSTGSFELARVRIRWNRGPAINLGFRDAMPDWQSPDIAIIRPADVPEDGSAPDFPENQDDREGFLIPPEGAEALVHKVGVRVWNFGDAEALNVQVGLVRRETNAGGGGDWGDVEDFTKTMSDPIAAGQSRAVFFDWPVAYGAPDHLCWRAEIGDRDVPTQNGVALASDDTDASNNWAQQNVFEILAESDSPPDPIHLTFEVNNTGSYTEEVRVIPVGLDEGATLTITPEKMKIAPRSRGFFQIKAELSERLLYAECGKDIDFRLVALREDDHAEKSWGSARYVLKPRFRTVTTLRGSLTPLALRLHGSVSPDVGAQQVLLQIDRPGEPTLWERVDLGPNSTFDFELTGDFLPQVEITSVAYYEGSFTHARSASAPLRTDWSLAG
jgi:hypothetical protein